MVQIRALTTMGLLRSKDWACAYVKEIFALRGDRNGKPVMMCSHCMELPEKDRFTDRQLQLTGITKAKLHVALGCPWLKVDSNIEHKQLRHTILVNISQKSVTTKKGLRLCGCPPMFMYAS